MPPTPLPSDPRPAAAPALRSDRRRQLLLIAPASGRWQHIGRSGLFSGRTFRFSLLSLLSVAAATPPERWEVTVVDEQVERVPLEARPDLVGLTCMTALAPRAYEISDAFRAAGVPVVFGGMHPTFLAEEALGHADAVVVGEAEGAWEQVLADTEAGGRPAGIYRAPAPPDLARLAVAPRHLLRRAHYGTVQSIQASRGCPHRCGFCSISAFSKATQRRRPPADVAAEIAALPERFVMFVDDNLCAHRAWAMELFERMAPLGKRWVTQTTLALGDDPELVAAAARSGCFGVFVGLETFSREALASVHKSFNRVARYREAVDRLHAAGIGVEAGIVFGLDGHDAAVFEETLASVEQLAIDAVQVSIATPLPGTELWTDWQGRITDRDWANYDMHHVVFEPAGMSAADLQAGHDWFTREFYAPWRIARRMARWVARPRGLATAPYAAALNLAYMGRARRWGLRGHNPAAALHRRGRVGEAAAAPVTT